MALLSGREADRTIAPTTRDHLDFDRLYRAQGLLLRRLLERSVSKSDAEEYVQEAFGRLIARSASGASIAIPAAYLTRTAQNLVREHYRRARRSPFIVHSSLDMNGEPQSHMVTSQNDLIIELENRSELEKADRIIGLMNPVTRKVFLMSRVDQMGYSAISDAANISIKAVEHHISSAIKHVRKRANALPISTGSCHNWWAVSQT
jgi:RNA polymerase sigma factor (sigma-70 family)